LFAVIIVFLAADGKGAKQKSRAGLVSGAGGFWGVHTNYLAGTSKTKLVAINRDFCGYDNCAAKAAILRR